MAGWLPLFQLAQKTTATFLPWKSESETVRPSSAGRWKSGACLPTSASLVELAPRSSSSALARQLKPAKVIQVEDQTLRFILKEGRNRQIRRMCDLVDLKVVDLFRVRIGPLSLGDLPEG